MFRSMDVGFLVAAPRRAFGSGDSERRGTSWSVRDSGLGRTTSGSVPPWKFICGGIAHPTQRAGHQTNLNGSGGLLFAELEKLLPVIRILAKAG